MAYATKTEVPVERSQAEIRTCLARYGADAFTLGEDMAEGRAAIGFRIASRYVRIDLPLPNMADFRLTPVTKEIRSAESVRRAWDQACRARWRALLLVIRAKLEAVELGISTVEREFLADVVLPDNRTLGEVAIPQIVAAYESGEMPRLLPAASR